MNPYILIVLAAALWALLGVFTLGLLDVGVGAMEIAFWRAVIAGVLFIVHAYFVGGLKLRNPRDGAIFVGFGLVGITLFFIALTLAIEAGGISLAIVLLYTAPVFVIILARIFLQEAITAVKLTAVAMVIVGVALVALSGGGPGVRVSVTSVFWGIVAGLGYSSFYIIGKYLLTHYKPVTVYAFILPVGALGILPFVEFGPKSTTAWALLVGVSVLSTYLAYLVYYTGLRRAEASRAVLVASLEPVIAATLAAVIFGERFGLWGLGGAGLVVAASVIGVIEGGRNGEKGKGEKVKGKGNRRGGEGAEDAETVGGVTPEPH